MLYLISLKLCQMGKKKKKTAKSINANFLNIVFILKMLAALGTRDVHASHAGLVFNSLESWETRNGCLICSVGCYVLQNTQSHSDERVLPLRTGHCVVKLYCSFRFRGVGCGVFCTCAGGRGGGLVVVRGWATCK